MAAASEGPETSPDDARIGSESLLSLLKGALAFSLIDQARGRLRLSRDDAMVLMVLARTPATRTSLVTRTGVRAGVAARCLARLERRGLAVRSMDGPDADRWELTAAGAESADLLNNEVGDRLRFVLQSISGDDRAEIMAALDELTSSLLPKAD
jgi:DNA-binding MarR family transcriptional regulator